MKFRISLIALVSAVSLPALATSGITPVQSEVGYTIHAMPSAKTRAEVMNELEAWKRNPVSADGWREVGGEVGWVFVGTNNSGRTRASVIAEMIEAKRNPVSAEGWLDVGGEVGVVYVGVQGDTRNAANTGKPAGMRDTSMMDRHMKVMQSMHEKIASAKTPTEREALMAEHMKLMQEGMSMMTDRMPTSPAVPAK